MKKIDIPIPSDSERAASAERRLFAEDRNCLSWWFPKLLAAGLPVPQTRIVRIPVVSVQRDLLMPFDGLEFRGPAKTWLGVLTLAVEEIGLPCFLRTGHTSNKHEWTRTCYLESLDEMIGHVLALIEFSEIADMVGLSWNVWAVRELLPTKPVATIYRGMPLCREFRCFVDGNKLLCRHPYWPPDAIAQGLHGETLPKDRYANLEDTTAKERAEIAELAKAAGKACGGRWSVDVLDTDRGWYVTDMARMERSYHWPGCPHGAEI